MIISKKTLSVLSCIFIATSSFVIYSCNNPTENKSTTTATKDNNVKDTSKPVDIVKPSNIVKKNGMVKLNLDGSFFSNMPKIKDLDLNNTVKKLNLEVKGLNISNSITQLLKWSPNVNTSFSLSVPEGDNRILVLSALDNSGKIIGTFMGTVNVKAEQDNVAKISYFDTSIAQVLLNILNSDKKDLVESLNSSDLKTFVTKVTGFNETSNTFEKIQPSVLNTSFISDSLIKNGKLPSETSPELKKTGSLKVNINQTGAKVFLSDPNSKVIPSTSSNETTIDGVSLGEWYLTVEKSGYTSQAVKVDINNSSNSVSVNLERSKIIEPQILAQPQEAKVLAPIKDKDFGISVNNWNFTFGADTNKNGGEEKISNGSVEIPGFGSHQISMKSEVFPVMSNQLSTLTISDKTPYTTGMTVKANEIRTNDIAIKVDSEYQYISVSLGVFSFELEANLDGSWTVIAKNEQMIIRTVDDIKKFILKYPELRTISIHSLGALYTLIQNRDNLPIDIKDIKTLSLSGPCDGKNPYCANSFTTNYYDARQNILDLLNKIITAVKELSSLFSLGSSK
ncbi:MAG: hypothetical protein U0354_19985 [Candidatus Sericytochromatia bacterium]